MLFYDFSIFWYIYNINVDEEKYGPGTLGQGLTQASIVISMISLLLAWGNLWGEIKCISSQKIMDLKKFIEVYIEKTDENFFADLTCGRNQQPVGWLERLVNKSPKYFEKY